MTMCPYTLQYSFFPSQFHELVSFIYKPSMSASEGLLEIVKLDKLKVPLQLTRWSSLELWAQKL